MEARTPTNPSGDEALQALRRWCEQPRCSADWLVVEQSRIDAFAEATGDRYWLHTDPQRAAREGPFGGTIAHGFLLLSLTVADDVAEIAGMPGIVHVLNYGLDKVRFLAPVVCGARIRVHSRLDSLSEKRPGQWLLRQNRTIEVEGQAKPALMAEQLTLLVLA